MGIFRRSLWETNPKIDPGTFSFPEPGWIGWHMAAIPLIFIAGRVSKQDRVH
ncbi:MAG: hypothetical protein K9L17_01220 [Clostridiales bacterium]|nr:hypothetical protein [Clostridiales bacterium]MCF8021312.1 hypothetical protein [Clostridiales bacterium]